MPTLNRLLTPLGGKSNLTLIVLGLRAGFISHLQFNPKTLRRTLSTTLNTCNWSAGQNLRVQNLENVSGIIQPGASAFVGFNRSKNLLIATYQVAWTPSGYFSSSPNSEQLINFHVNRGEGRAADFYASSRFIEDLYQPKLIKWAYELGHENVAISEYEQESGLTLM